MNNRVFVWSCFVMTFFVACQQAEVENQEAEDLRMSISASINGQSESPHSRYVGDDPNNVEFDEDDTIGLFIDDDSEPAIEWIYGEDGWSSGEAIVYWPDKTDSHTFRAFYPYQEATSIESVPMPPLSTQHGTMESISDCDFLVATTTQKYALGGQVKFEGSNSFKHVSTLLKLTFNGGGDLNGSTMTRIVVSGNSVTASATYSFTEEKVTLEPEDDASDDVLDVSISEEYGGIGTEGRTYYLIVNGISKSGDDPEFKLTVEYVTEGQTHVASLDNFADSVFTGGTCQSYTFTIKDRALVVTGSEIAPWDNGDSLDNVEINGEVKPASV